MLKRLQWTHGECGGRAEERKSVMGKGRRTEAVRTIGRLGGGAVRKAGNRGWKEKAIKS